MASSRMADVDLAARVARLTAGQRECLDLVDDHATSKEIARQLGISRHTVDARLRGAIQTLGVSSRREAAIIYRAAMQAETYQPFAYQSSRIVTQTPEPEDAGDDADVEHFEPIHAGQASAELTAAPQPVAAVVSDSAVWTAVPPAGFTFRQPSLRLWGGSNDLSPSQRVVGILVVTILAMLAFGVFLTGIEALALLRS